ncbi:MAG TPA: methanogenesis marker 16 metalloprotein [Methanothrix sp.]|jgi:putative methanogenesis marker 16 metalloprotein|nr:methanogenesis marker 16 metalloprotein [Methanothrix sp.]HOV81232.1 methanogenesis marker 16 metalloprotein [Methanothrix sp.]HPC88843.1 methanogenesis marker 16 metalloprotein [Methanothrix sp.]HQE87269.1 methanogenesis marker 16 metalloprotein [Methanothrix sp.]HQI67821.1 methanogenesis marker 16 metalloprotein [Methanothrix sp.]
MAASLGGILKRVERGEAVVLTAEEAFSLAESEGPDALRGVDVVTAATRAVMSGTFAVLSFSVAPSGAFLRAEKAWINGIAAFVGPCPNENLGVLDLVVFGTAHSRDRPGYGGGHLFRDLVEGKRVDVQVLAEGGRSLRCDVALDEMPHARLYGSRHAFKNYSAFVNAGGMPASTIFHARPFAPHLQEATFSGCGRVSPLKNDPLLETIGTGSRILLNGAEGFVIGAGTRSSLDRPNLSAFADMHCMRAEYMGGFATAAGPECICSLAVAIPLVSERILQEVARPDGEIDLPVNDVACRQQVGLSDYGDVWDGSDLEVEFDPASCLGCQRCQVEQACPMGAVTGGMDKDGTARATRDEGLCFHCGLCVSVCPSSAFSARLGEIMMKSNMQSTIEGGAAEGCAIPVVLRQSDRLRALRLAEELKRRILDGSFRMAPPVERIY